MDSYMAQLNQISNSNKKDLDSLSDTTSIRSAQTQPIYEEKKAILLQALNLKKAGKLKEYYTLINQQSFVRAKEEPVALRIWVKVFLDSMSLIIHEYKDYELLELLLFKLPWFSPQSTHSRYFRYFQSLIFAVFPHDPSYIHKVISHAFSPFGFFQCILNGEMRSPISEILWKRAVTIIEGRNDFQEEEIGNLHLNYKTMKSPEEILNRAKVLLKSYSDQVQTSQVGIRKQTKKVNVKEHEIFLKALFSFSPSRNLNQNFDYTIFVGTFQDVPGFYVIEDKMIDENESPSLQDFISMKKCLLGLNQEYFLETQSFKDKKFESTPLKLMAPLLIKMMKTYPLTQSAIFKNLQDRLPHKKSPIENQLIYNQVLYQVIQQFPKKEKQFLLLIIEKLSQLDMEIKLKYRGINRGTLQVQDIERYIKVLQVRVQDENQLKFAHQFQQLLDYLEKKVLSLGEKNDNYEEDLLYLFKRKIFSLSKLNFLQYLPLFIMNLKSEKNQIADLFTKKWLTFLILTSFNTSSEENLIVRQQAWNYLCGFLSRQSSVFDEEFFFKCLQQIMIKFEETQKISQEDQKNKSSEQLFQHNLTQGFALLIITKGEDIKRINPETYYLILKTLFRTNQNSLQYCSSYILWDLIQVANFNQDLTKYKEKLQKCLKQQRENQNSSKRHIYSKVSRYIPYEQPFILIGVQNYFDSLIYVKTYSYNNDENSQSEESQELSKQQRKIDDKEETKIPKSDSILYDPREFQFLKKKNQKQGYNSSEEQLDSDSFRDIKQHRSHSSNHSEISNQETQHSVENPFSQTFDKSRGLSPTRKLTPPSKSLTIKEQTHRVRQLNGKAPIPFSHSN